MELNRMELNQMELNQMELNRMTLLSLVEIYNLMQQTIDRTERNKPTLNFDNQQRELTQSKL